MTSPDPTWQDIAGALEAEIRRMAEVEPDDPDFTHDTHLFDYGYLDSMGAAKLVQFSADRFGVRVTDEALATEPLNTIREITDYLHRQLGGAA